MAWNNWRDRVGNSLQAWLGRTTSWWETWIRQRCIIAIFRVAKITQKSFLGFLEPVDASRGYLTVKTSTRSIGASSQRSVQLKPGHFIEQLPSAANTSHDWQESVSYRCQYWASLPQYGDSRSRVSPSTSEWILVLSRPARRSSQCDGVQNHWRTLSAIRKDRAGWRDGISTWWEAQWGPAWR